MLINTKILRTSTFRLSALYLLIFAFSMALILSYVFWNTAGLLERQTDETIRAEVQGLADQYRVRRLAGITDVIQRRMDEENGALYLLADGAGVRLAGNIVGFPQNDVSEQGWIDFPYDVGQGTSRKRHTARAYHTELTGGFVLVVGRDVQELRQFADLIRSTLFWALGLALLFGLSGGFIISRNFLSRVDDIAATSHSIMSGDLSRRMPVSDTDDELDRLARSLNDMLDQIERLMAGMKEVTSNIAHDLKTPLTRLRARVEAALRSAKKADYHEALTATLEDSDRLLQTFNALLSIARAEAGQSREGLLALDAHDVLADIAELYEPMAEEAGGTLILAAPAGLMVKADRQLLAQALGNLIDNALKYGEGGKGGAEVALSGAADEGQVVITVADHGPGIAEADRERVVERFVRLDESRSKPGNGLGLALVASVMKLHGGQLVLEDNAPGLRAKLLLPLLEKTA